jgi:branched-chain amino acid transport system substrate-binding protein
MAMSRLCAALGIALVIALPAAVRAADPIKIGMVVPLTGSIADAGRYGVQGAKLAIEEVNKAGGALGRPLELVIEDDQSLNPATVLAFSKLADKDIVAFLGPTRSTQIQSIAPGVKQAGRPVMIGGTDPSLTLAGNPWLFRFRPNDTYTARVMSDYGLNKLGKKKWAIVHATDAFGTTAKNLFTDALKQSGADVLATFITFEPDVAIFARQLRQLGVNIVWLGSPSITTTTARKLAGSTLFGTFAVADFHPDANPEAKAFSEKYLASYKTTPDFFASWPYDAVHVLAKAIESAGGTDPQKIREALLAVKGYRGVEGTYHFDKNGDGLHGYNIVRNDNGNIVVEKRIDFDD